MSAPKVKAGRNDPCPCGSGEKFKRCCGKVAEAVVVVEPTAAEVGQVVALLNGGRHREAEVRARDLLTRFPRAGILWKALSVAQMRQGTDALAACTRAASLLPRDAEAQHNLGSELAERRQWPAAVAALRDAVALAPRQVDYVVDLANALRENGDPATAAELYRRALGMDPRHAEARNNLGNALMALYRPADAAESYRLALELRPDEPLILCNLSNALRQTDRAPEALSVAERALAREPGSVAARNFAALALLSLGRRGEAITLLREALSISPREPIVLTSLAQALREAGAHREALECAQAAVDLDPAYADGHCTLGSAQFDARLVDAAAQSFRRALERVPRHVAAMTGLALVLRQQRRAAEAQAALETALALDPGCVPARSLLGELLADQGRFADAEAIFREVLTANPRFGFAYANIAAHRRMTSADVDWQRAVERLLEGPLPVDQRISLCYALGKYHDDLGRYDEAFARFRDGNELNRSVTAPYDPARFSARVDRLLAECGGSFIDAAATHALSAETPVFVVGMPRSGTSLVEQILASHPAVFGAGEIAFWDSAFDEAHAPDGRLDAARAAGLAGAYLERLQALAPHAQRVVDKMPANFLYLGLIHALFPRARVIHLRRNPVDTCLSIYFQNFFSLGQYTNDLDALVHYYREYVRITDRWRALLPAAAYLEVPYEALVADQEAWTRRIVDFVGLPWDSRCLAFEATERAVITASKWQVRQKIDARSAGRWRHYERHLGPLAALFPAGPDPA